jgi:farnesol dehydrogenase
MKIFVTGATGFIGKRLVEMLLETGNEVHAIYRSKSKSLTFEHEHLKWFQGDILDIQSIETAMEGCGQVYHIAAFASVWENTHGDFSKYNIQGTINIIETAKKLGINNIVATSTAGVFGPSLNGIITEKTISQIPYFTGYERSKAESERIISDYVKKDLRIIIVNPTRVYGPGALNESNSVTKMIKSYITGKWHIIPGNGTSIGNYVFVDDVANGHILAMEKGKPGERYILGGENVSYNNFFETLSKISGRKYLLIKMPLWAILSMGYFMLFLNKRLKIRPRITPQHVRKFNYNWEVSSKKSETEFGYTYTSLQTGIAKTIQWLNII